MHVALLLLLCSTAVHTGVSQTLPTILPRTETVAPPVQRCTLDDQIAFISALPNAEECGLSLQTVFTPPANDSMALNKALKSVCTNNCGGIYASFLQTTCNDEVGAETLRIHCTPTSRSAAAGPYCSYAIGGFINESMFNNLYLCNESDVCSPGCRKALENFKTQVGCCYQNAYNNSVYNQQLFDAGFITPSEFVALQKLNSPVGSPWNLCDIKPPQRCGPSSIMPPAPPRCKLEDQISFISSLPNAAVCGPSIATVFEPPANNTMALRKALEDICTNDCGGVYSNFLKSTCNDQFGVESLTIYCTPTNGSAAVGNYCRFAAGDILNNTLFDDLNSCYNGTVDSPCTDGCREALLRLKRQTGCCYQNVYNNTMYNRELLNAGFITPSEFSGLQKLNDPYFSPWTFCEIKPPRRCGAPVFRPPLPPRCTLDDQIAYVSSLPNATVCGPSIATVFQPPANNTMALRRALADVCTNDCGGVYSNFLKSTCNDQFGAESLRIYCTPTNGSAAVGNYCRFAAGDILNNTLFDDLNSCYNGTVDSPCTDGCREALLRLKRQTGCCYQNVYNNTMYNRELLNAGFITPSEFSGLQKLNDPYFSPWTFCEIKPPRRCGAPIFRPPPPPRCTLDDQIAFLSSTPNIDATVCGLSIATVFQSPANNNMALRRALANACINDCGGVYSKFLESTCNDRVGSESLRIYCTPTNGSTTVGNYCRFAAGDILNATLFDDLDLCSKRTVDSPCPDDCREALLRLKRQTGCCYQNIYNNTAYYRELLNAGFVTPTQFTGLQQLNNPGVNQWTLCGIEPPRRCGTPTIKPPASPNCTLDDQISFLTSLPNAAVCGQGIATALGPTPSNPTVLTKALMDVCTRDCAGAYSNFLRSTCNDWFAAENLRVLCVSTNKSDIATPGPYCRFATDVDISYFDTFPCQNSSSGTSCAPECRSALLRIKADVGCCYQELYNNTLYSREQLLAGFLPPVVFTELQLLNNPVTNPWKVCNVTPPTSCTQQPRPDGKCICNIHTDNYYL